MMQIEPCLLNVFKFNQIQNNQDQEQSLWIQYICLKYPLLKTLELESSSMYIHQDLHQSHVQPLQWYMLALHCAHLQRLSLFGFTLDQPFFTHLIKNKQIDLRTLKLSTTTHFRNQQAPIIPISDILKRYQHTLEDLVFWPCHVIWSTIDLIHPNLMLCQHLKRLSVSGIHLLHDTNDDLMLDLPIDTLLKYGLHLCYLKLEYTTLSYHNNVHHRLLEHVSFQHVTLSNAVLTHMGTTCPNISHLSLVYCRFLNKTIRIDMPLRFNFFNLHYPYTMHDHLPPSKNQFLFKLNHTRFYHIYNNGRR